MKRSILLSILFLLTSIVHGQLNSIIDSIYDVIKVNDVHSNSVNWDVVDRSWKKQLAEAKNDLDTMACFVNIFEELNDFHSAIIYKGQYLTNYPVFDDSVRNYLWPLVNLSNTEIGRFSYSALSPEYVYLQVPGVQAMGESVTTYAQMLSDSLSSAITEKTKGVILDLRLNGGGQFSSMVAGVAPLLGDGYIGGGRNKDSVQSMEFHLRNGNILLNNVQITSVVHKVKRDLTKIPVALLIGPITKSSGSILAIAFKGRENTVFIGDDTATGYTTSNDFFDFGNDTYLNLSTANSIDRNGNIYSDHVSPDIYKKGQDDFENRKEDVKIRTALIWLKSMDK